MKPAASSDRVGVGGRVVAAILWFGIVAGGSAGAERRTVLVHGMPRSGGDGVMIWAALVDADAGPEEKTVVLHRRVLGDAEWHGLPAIPARAVALTDHANELVLLLQNRTWVWFSGSSQANRFSYGPPLPNEGRIVALAGHGRALWALGRVREPSSRPGEDSGRRVATTRPVGLRLFRLESRGWKEQEAAWPEPLGERALLSMGVVAGEPHVAVWTKGSESIDVYRFDEETSQWWKVYESAVKEVPKRLKLVSVAQKPAVWYQGEHALGQLWMRGQWVALEAAGAQPEPGAVDVTVAGDQIRILFRQNGALLEQRYALNGTADGQPMRVNWASSQAQPSSSWLATAVMATLAMLVAGALMRKRTAEEEERPGRDD